MQQPRGRQPEHVIDAACTKRSAMRGFGARCIRVVDDDPAFRCASLHTGYIATLPPARHFAHANHLTSAQHDPLRQCVRPLAAPCACGDASVDLATLAMISRTLRESDIDDELEMSVDNLRNMVTELPSAAVRPGGLN